MQQLSCRPIPWTDKTQKPTNYKTLERKIEPFRLHCASHAAALDAEEVELQRCDRRKRPGSQRIGKERRVVDEELNRGGWKGENEIAGDKFYKLMRKSLLSRILILTQELEEPIKNADGGGDREGGEIRWRRRRRRRRKAGSESAAASPGTDGEVQAEIIGVSSTGGAILRAITVIMHDGFTSMASVSANRKKPIKWPKEKRENPLQPGIPIPW